MCVQTSPLDLNGSSFIVLLLLPLFTVVCSVVVVFFTLTDRASNHIQ